MLRQSTFQLVWRGSTRAWWTCSLGTEPSTMRDPMGGCVGVCVSIGILAKGNVL